MSRSLTSSNSTESQASIVREHFLVLLDFSSPVRLSSREAIPSFDGNSYVSADMQLELSLDGARGRLTFLDNDFSKVPDFISEGSAGISCSIWALYGDAPFSASDDDVLFVGELGAWGMADNFITVNLETPEAKWLPDIKINVENGFNHLPKVGTQIKTEDGIIVLGNL